MNPLESLDVEKLSQEEKKKLIKWIVESPENFAFLTDKVVDELGFDSDLQNAKAETLQDHIRSQAEAQSQQKPGPNAPSQSVISHHTQASRISDAFQVCRSLEGPDRRASEISSEMPSATPEGELHLHKGSMDRV